MAVTFGATTGDVLQFTAVNSSRVGYGAGSSTCMWGWFKPTTFTSGRPLFAAGNNTLSLTGSSELLFVLARINSSTLADTSASYTTSGAAVVVNEWRFFCLVTTTTAAPTSQAVRLWLGSTTDSPVAATLTANVPAAASTIATTSFISQIGNTSASTTPFIGQLDNFEGFGPVTSIYQIATVGTITSLEEQLLLESIVTPAWLSSPISPMSDPLPNRTLFNLTTPPYDWTLVSSIYSQIAPTVGGTLTTLERCPRPSLVQTTIPVRTRR